MEPDGDEPRVRNVNEGLVHGDVNQAATINIYNGLSEKATVKPFQLPAAKPHLNHIAAMAELTSLATAPAGSRPRAALISGYGGLGKTALAVHWAHQNADMFPDGVLFIDLPAERANGDASLKSLLKQGIEAFGADASTQGLSALSGKYRSVMWPKRVLVVLDGVANGVEAEALMPNSPDSLLIMTSHANHQYIDGQLFVALEPLDLKHARKMVCHLLGDARRVAAAEPEFDEIIKLCQAIPRVLSIAVSPLKQHRSKTPADVVDRLKSALGHSRASASLGELMDAVAGQAYEFLSVPAAKVYRYLGWHPGPDISEEEVYALAESGEADGQEVLDELVDHHLVEPGRLGRFELNRLIKAHARAKSRDIDGDNAERNALSIMVDWYVARAQAADHAAIPTRTRVFPPVFDSNPFVEAAATAGTDDAAARARDWFAAEQHNLLALQRCCSELGWHLAVMRLAEAMWVMYVSGRFLDDWLASSKLGAEAAVAAKHLLGEIRFRAFYGRAHMDNDNLADAEGQLKIAREMRCTVGIGGDLRASALEMTGRQRGREGRDAEAIEWHREAMRIFAAQAQRSEATEAERKASLRGVALQHQFIGQLQLKLEEFDAALESLRQAKSRMSSVTHGRDIAKIDTEIGEALRRGGDPAAALIPLTEAVEFLAGNGWNRVEAEARWQLSLANRAAGDVEAERSSLKQLRELYITMHHERLTEVEERLVALA